MNIINISAIALSNRDFPSLDAKIAEAAQWTALAAEQGADLVVLPETLNLYRGDGDGNPDALGVQDVALEDWQTPCAPLIDAACRHGAAVVVPLFIRDSAGDVFNVFHFVSEDGNVLGTYRKTLPTPQELHDGVKPGTSELIAWRGLKVGGAICFDCYYEHVFARQADAGADLFVVPSLTPAGFCLDYYALRYSVPIVLAYPAWSRIIDADGQEQAAGGYRHETLRFGFGTPIVSAGINFDRVVLFAGQNQNHIAAIERKYAGRVAIRFNQHNCTFLLESRSPDLAVSQVVEEFGLIARRDHFAEALSEACRYGHCPD